MARPLSKPPQPDSFPPSGQPPRKLGVDYEALGDRFGRNLALDFLELGTGKGMEFCDQWRTEEHALFLERLAFLVRLGASIPDITNFTEAASVGLHRTFREADVARAQKIVGRSSIIVVPQTSFLQ
ncbi:hypothetical protein OIU35_15140 [Boseaceae bacterium BT-24-1]|nr:hypothetical protein [Boseaceae bacterium BT-24-1]